MSMSVFLVSLRDEIDFAMSRFNLAEEEACHLVQCLSLTALTNSGEYGTELNCVMKDTRLEDLFQLTEGMELVSDINTKLGECLTAQMYDLNKLPNSVMFINKTDLIFG